MSAAVRRWNVTGHDEAIARLDADNRRGRVSHAYLITGPQGVGRTTLALAFARALNCQAPLPERPCGVCESCRRIRRDAEHRSHPDVTLVDLEWQAAMFGGARDDRSRQRQRLSIETVRWLRQDIVSRPVMGRWKVQIIDDAEQFSEAAPEAFLKTLEEPPSSAVILLIASSPDAVPETIRSRCREVALGIVPREAIEQALVATGCDTAQARDIAAVARGRIARAFDLASDPEALLRRRERVNEALEHLSDPLGRLTISGRIAQNHTRERDKTFALLDTYAGLWRDAILLRSGMADLVAYPEVSGRLEEYASKLEFGQLHRALRATCRAIDDLEHNFQARVALHAMVMQWP